MARTIGISGGLNCYGHGNAEEKLSPFFFHDAAAALVVDGRVVFAVEEERLSRNKHTNAFPERAVTACLTAGSFSAEDIDEFAFFFSEEFCDAEFFHNRLPIDLGNCLESRTLLGQLVSTAASSKIPASKLRFVTHHDAHCASALDAAGWDESLVLVIDGNGESESGSLFLSHAGNISVLRRFSLSNSLGHFYRLATQLLGFSDFSEYKVMGLAGFGTASRIIQQMAPLFDLRESGDYTLQTRQMPGVAWGLGLRARRRDDPITELHRDFAAGIQFIVEEVVLHVLRWWRLQTTVRSLCLAGGVAQNCALNGRIARELLFDRIYVHPASHDAGAAIGAALIAHGPVNRRANNFVESHVNAFSPLLGPAIEVDGEIERVLTAWHPMIHYSRLEVKRVATTAADHLAKGEVIAWVNGRSEFGPRALGNRSILADPRPASNRDRINLLIKDREDFRPFAPAVLAEYLHDYFVVPECECNWSDMVFTLSVQPDRRQELGAVTHVDGTARVQRVSEATNKAFWGLLRSFHELTDCPILLNTSFNNSCEPIVQDVHDAIRAFLTTGLDKLFIGEFVVQKGKPVEHFTDRLCLTMPSGTRISKALTKSGWISSLDRLGFPTAQLSMHTAQLLEQVGGSRSIGEQLQAINHGNIAMMIEELLLLWKKRLVDIRTLNT